MPDKREFRRDSLRGQIIPERVDARKQPAQGIEAHSVFDVQLAMLIAIRASQIAELRDLYNENEFIHALAMRAFELGPTDLVPLGKRHYSADCIAGKCASFLAVAELHTANLEASIRSNRVAKDRLRVNRAT